MNSPDLPARLQGFFTERLRAQLDASPHMVAAYRDTFRLLLRFAAERLKQEPSKLRVEQLDPSFVGEFLRHLEVDRGNSARTRNMRLAALRAFFRYVAVNEPAHALQCQRLLAMPSKRHQRGPVEFLAEDEVAALVASPDTDTWLGRRDRTLLVVATQTGLRNSEITGLRRRDVEFGAGAHVRCLGKGRKTRCTPLSPDTAAILGNGLRSGGERGTTTFSPPPAADASARTRSSGLSPVMRLPPRSGALRSRARMSRPIRFVTRWRCRSCGVAWT